MTTTFPTYQTDILSDNLSLIALCARFAGFTLPLDPIEAGRQIVSELSLTFADVRRMTSEDCRRSARVWVSLRSAG